MLSEPKKAHSLRTIVFLKVTASDVDTYHYSANCHVTHNHPNESAVMLMCVVVSGCVTSHKLLTQSILITSFKWNKKYECFYDPDLFLRM